jgi:hypothetical protein
VAILIVQQMPPLNANRLRAHLRRRRLRGRPLHAAQRRAQLCDVVLVSFLCLAAAIPTRAQAPPSVEYQVKAAFLLNFVKFIEWPPEVFPNEKAPITLCVFGHDPFGSALDDIIRGRTVNNRAVLVRRINEKRDLKSCQLVFVSAAEDKRLPEVLNNLKDTSAIVVGEGEGFAEHGGGIQFFLEDNRLRFAVNVDAVQRARLRVSSKLLALARIVHEQDRPKEN